MTQVISYVTLEISIKIQGVILARGRNPKISTLNMKNTTLINGSGKEKFMKGIR